MVESEDQSAARCDGGIDRPQSLGRLLRTLLLAGLIVPVCSSIAAQDSSSQKSANPSADAATAQILASYDGQNVTSIEVAGHPNADPTQFSSLFVQRAGQPFSKDKIDRTVAALKAHENSADVQVQVEPDANGVRVLLILEPAVYFGIFEFPGAEQFAYSRLAQVANAPSQVPFSASEIETDRQALIGFFRQEGYFEAEVRSEVKADSIHAVANVAFHTTLHRCARFGELKISDGTPEEEARLAHSLTTLMARLRSAGVREGKTYHYSTLTHATAYLQSELQKQNYLGAQVKLSGAEYHADTNSADIHFDVTLGPPTQVTVDGAHLFSWTRKSLLPVYQGIGVDQESVQEGRQALLSYFQAKGFFDVTVDAELKTQGKGAAVIYKIDKEKKHRVSEVKLYGNSAVPSSELQPQIKIEKKHTFSSGKFSEQLVRSSVKNLKAVYESEGFSSAQVTPTVVNHGGDIQVSFKVVEGPRDIVNSLTIEGATIPASEFAPGGLKLAANHPYSQAHVQADRVKIATYYLQAGYLISSFSETAVKVSKQEPHRINVVYHIVEGPRVYTGDILTLGRAHTQQRLIDRDVSSMKSGQPLTESQLLTAGSRLYDHQGVFDWAEVDPKRQITTQTKEDVLVKVHEAKRNEMTYGFGFEVINRGGSIPSGTVALPGLPPIGIPATFRTSQATFYGPRGTFQYTRNNVGGKGDSLSFTAFAGRLDQRGAAYYIAPDFRWSQWKATTTVSGERNEENPLFSSQEELIGSQLQRTIDKARKDTLFLRYSFSQTDITRLLIEALVPPEDQHVRLSTLAANLTRDTRDNPLDEHKGMLQSIETDFSTTKLGSSVNFAKMTGQTAWYKQAFHNIVWAESIRIGLAQPFANSRVPLSEAFFSGGGNTLRGFPLDGAGPQRAVQICGPGLPCNSSTPVEILVPAGGNELLIVNSEARIPMPFKKGLSIVPFYDGGNVFPIPGFHDFVSLYSNNVGLGLRYATPVGPIRFDVGQNLNPVTGIKATQYFISIGQAF